MSKCLRATARRPTKLSPGEARGSSAPPSLGIPVASKIASFRRPISKHVKTYQLSNGRSWRKSGPSKHRQRPVRARYEIAMISSS
jgi:hypothetical protein